jgi:hypothetical protein
MHPHSFRFPPTTLTPPLLRQLRRQGGEFGSRFAAAYQSLRALPRRVRRQLQRQWKQSLAGVAILLALGQAPVQAATTINVPAGDTTALIQAISNANSEVVPYDGHDTIVLANSTFTFTAPYAATDTALPVISSAITIEGNGSTLERDATATEDFRLLAINADGDLTLQDTTVSGGVAGEGGGFSTTLGS